MPITMKNDSIYYICASGKAKATANQYRETYIRLKSALNDAVKPYPVREWSVCETMMLIRGVTFKRGEAPEGWTKPNRSTGLCRPLRTKENAGLLKSFTPFGSYCVERHQDLRFFFDWLKCPTSYEYTTKTGEGFSRISNAIFDPVGLAWFSAESPILLWAPDVASAKVRAAERGEIVKDNKLDWTPPRGLRRILHEEWKLMEAKHEARCATETAGGAGNG